jgi:hypothetical protein
MKFWAIVVLLIFWLIVYLLFKQAHNEVEMTLVTILAVFILWLMARNMTWVFVEISRSFDNETQKCTGWMTDETHCFGLIEDRY